MEIGSEFWIDSMIMNNNSEEIPNWLSQFGNVSLTTSGRGALLLLLNQIKPRIMRALLPSYICESVIKPFEKLGYEVIFYDIGKDLKPIDIEFITKSQIGVFLHMGYFGFPTNDDLSNLISSLRTKSIITIEDVTHTMFSKQNIPLNSDFVIGSIRKWIGIPSGGFLATNKNVKLKPKNKKNEFTELRKLSLLQKSEYIKTGDKNIKSSFLEGFTQAEILLDQDNDYYTIDNDSKKILKNFNYNHLETTRRLNFSFLQEKLSNIKEVEFIFSQLEDSIVPIFFPIYVEDNRNELRSLLTKNEIYCPVHWPIPNQLIRKLHTSTQNIYDSVLSIPCDQRYQIEDMQRIVDVIVNYFKE